MSHPSLFHHASPSLRLKFRGTLVVDIVPPLLGWSPVPYFPRAVLLHNWGDGVPTALTVDLAVATASTVPTLDLLT